MTQAFPSPATQKTNGVVERGNERELGMSYRQWLMGKILEGTGASLARLTRDEFDLLRSRVIELALALDPD